MDAYKTINLASNTWAATNDGSYQTKMSYDVNGNILTLDRNGVAPNLVMDKLKYKYENVANGYVKNTNKLRYVEDVPSTYNTDIDNQAADNYEYDAIGNLVKDKAEKLNTIDWSISGKPLRIEKQENMYDRSEIEFRYDAQGNRVAKIVKPMNYVTSPEGWQYTFYVRDASGNVMATYERSGSGASTDYKLIDNTIYGSSRLGLQKRDIPLVGVPSTETYKLYLNQKYYKLTDHRGNVNTTISDFRIGVGGTTKPNLIDHYAAHIRTTADYGVWGDELVGRGESMKDFRYGFNGKLKDDDIKGSGNSYDYGFRFYDPRVGKFLSIDPLTKKYPELTPFQFASNNPIWFIDLDGLEGVKYLEKSNEEIFGGPALIRVVEVDIYIAISKMEKSTHYKESDVPDIELNLSYSYNNGNFHDNEGNPVEFRFNYTTFDADIITPVDKAKSLMKEKTKGSEVIPNLLDKYKNPVYKDAVKGMVLYKKKNSNEGGTTKNLSYISKKAIDPKHTQVHELIHFFLMGSEKNPDTPEKHDEAGGALKIRKIMEGEVIQETEPLNQKNINDILENVPEIKK